MPKGDIKPGGVQTLAARRMFRVKWQGKGVCSTYTLFTLTLHPQTIGRGGRMHLLARLLEYFAQHAVEFQTMGDVAARLKAANPLAAWKQANPLMTGEHAIT